MHDFYIGARLHIYSRDFIIVDADPLTKSYMTSLRSSTSERSLSKSSVKITKTYTEQDLERRVDIFKKNVCSVQDMLVGRIAELENMLLDVPNIHEVLRNKQLKLTEAYDALNEMRRENLDLKSKLLRRLESSSLITEEKLKKSQEVMRLEKEINDLRSAEMGQEEIHSNLGNVKSYNFF